MKPLRQSQYPKELKIGDETYTIVWVRKFKDPHTVGECCSSDKEIRLKQGQSPADRLKTFIHETLHAFEMEYDIKISHKAIYQLEESIFHFLKHNT